MSSRRSAPHAALAATVVAAAMLALSACSADTGGNVEAATLPQDTVAVASLPSSSAEVSTTPATTAPPTTEAPTTVPPTTAVPTTVPTDDPTWVGKFPEQLVAVGTRNGPDTAKIQLRLLQLGFWNGGADGTYGLTTKQAVMAFQKYIGLEASGAVDEPTAAFLTEIDRRATGSANDGNVVEVDKTKQLLFFVVDGQTRWVFNTSTGDGLPYTEEDKNTPGVTITDIADTPNGVFKVNRERPEGWWEGDLGEIYRPKYFNGGIAVHGSNSVPNYPASHGCVRLTVPAMDFVWAQNLMPKGTTVWVHGG